MSEQWRKPARVEDGSRWPLVPVVAPMLLAVAVFVTVAVTEALPTWGLGLLTAGLGLLYVVLSKVLTEVLIRSVEAWRRRKNIPSIYAEDDPPAVGGESMQEMFREGRESVLWLIVSTTGMLFAAPVLIIVGLAIAAADAVT